MLEPRIEKHFIDSADLNYQAAQVLSKPIALAIEALLSCVTNGGKVLACASGGSAACAQHFAAQFIGRHEHNRPELGAMALSADGAVLTALAQRDGVDQIFAKQIRALADAGDILLAICADDECASLIEAIEAARQREMIIIALTGKRGGEIAAILGETDVHICVPHERSARIHEVHLLTLHCLCDGVDAMLLGDQETI